MIRRNVRVLTLLIWCIATMSVSAQTLELRSAPPPYFVGQQTPVILVVEGFDEQQEPKVEVKNKSDGLRLQLASVNPQVFSQTTIVNGRFSQSKTVTWRVIYYVSADQPGNYMMGPFEVSQGSQRLTQQAISMEFTEVAIDPDMQVILHVPAKSVYPGQRVPIRIEWLYELQSAKNSIHKLSIRSSLFDVFSFDNHDNDQDQQASSALPIQTEKGEINLPATQEQREVDGKLMVVLIAERTLIAERPGEFEFPPVSASIQKVTRWRRGFLGGREPAATESLRALASEPTRLVVKPFPVAGRPESFSGTVGYGFTINVTADRSVVRVGDPIPLTVTVGGNGNLENARLPSLSADGGMSAEQFRLPDGDIVGTYADDRKTFGFNIRVLDETISEIPSLAFSWFDPDAEAYQTTHSKPIALRVGEANVVSAEDVVRNQSQPEKLEQGESGTEEQAAGSASGQIARSFTLHGADLAVERTASEVFNDARRRFGGHPARVTIYVGSFALIALAIADRRRRNIDPAIRYRQLVLNQQLRLIQKASALPDRQSAEQIAIALRKIIAEVPDADRGEIQELLSECENLVYSPDPLASQGDTSLPQRATIAAKSIIEN